MDWKKIVDKHLEEFLLVMTMVLMVLVVFFQAVSRYAFDTSFSWGSEFARYVHIWQIWLGASLGIRMQEHVRVDFFINFLKGKVKFVVNILAIIIWFLFAAFLAYEGTIYVNNLLISNQTSATLGIPMGVIYIILPVSGVLMCIRLIQQIIIEYLKFKSTGDTREVK